MVVSELFQLFDSVRAKIGILDWGVKMTTLEDGKVVGGGGRGGREKGEVGRKEGRKGSGGERRMRGEERRVYTSGKEERGKRRRKITL